MKKSHIRFLFFILSCFTALTSYSQTEICGNGIDDDNDQLIDEYDPDCCANASTPNVFYDPCTTATCRFNDTLPILGLDVLFSTAGIPNVGGELMTLSTPVFGDLGEDTTGDVEIVVFYNNTNGGANNSNVLAILNPPIFPATQPTVEQIIQVPTGVNIGGTRGDNRSASIALGDVLNGTQGGTDGVAEIIVSVGSGTIYIFRSVGGQYILHTNTNNILLDIPNINPFIPNSGTINSAMAPNIADFDQDGIPEIYCGIIIIDPATGTVMNQNDLNQLNNLGFGGLEGRGTIEAFNQAFRTVYTVAVDAIDATTGPAQLPCGGRCDGLDLVAGNTVYSVQINRVGLTATLTPEVTARRPNNNNRVMQDGFTSVADWDNDGDLEGIITTVIPPIPAMNGNPARPARSLFYVWELNTGNVIRIQRTVIILDNGTQNTTLPSVGRANVGDLDGDGFVEAVFCQTLNLVAIENLINPTTTNATPRRLWMEPTTDVSGSTGTTMFDFNGDGEVEVVYRDEQQLRIINGNNGNNIQFVNCLSPTGVEHPTVGDVDKDGVTEVLVMCGAAINNANFFAFQPANTPWAPSRSVWNQSNYFYTNINDDLSVPPVQQSHQIVGGLNSYLNQYSDTLNRVADAVGSLDTAFCDLVHRDRIKISIEVRNNGERFLGFSTPISVYATNPLTGTATLVNTIPSALQLGQTSSDNLAVGAVDTIHFEIVEADFQNQYFILINDNGNTAPLAPIGPFSSNIAECNYTNNLVVVNHPDCCFAGTSQDYLPINPNAPNGNFEILNGYTVWPDKVYVPEGVTVVVANDAVLDITNCDVVFGRGAGIDFRNEAQLLAYNSVFRPCDDTETWQGLEFADNTGNLNGTIKECTFINAEIGVEVVETPSPITVLGFPIPEVEMKNNLFSNCYEGIAIRLAGNYTDALDVQISGNTFEWGDWEHIVYDRLPNDLNSTGIRINHFSLGIIREMNYPISQNDFINNTNHTSINSNYEIKGIDLNGSISATFSSNKFTNMNCSFLANTAHRADFIPPVRPNITFENNFIEVTRRSNRDLEYQIMFTRDTENRTCIAHVSGNTIVNSASVNTTILDPTILANNVLRGSGAIYTNNISHITDNEIIGFEVGVFSDGRDAIGGPVNFTFPVRIVNNKIEAYIYGIYRRGFSATPINPNFVIACNEINLKQEKNSIINSVGICYEISLGGTEGILQAAPGLANVRQNCISNADIGLQIANNNMSANGLAFLPLTPVIANNFFHNYHASGIDALNFENRGYSTRITRNTFFSNNKGTNTVVDIAHEISSGLPSRPFDVHSNDFGSTTPVTSGVNIQFFHVTGVNDPAAAACAGQDAGQSNVLNFDCNDESILGNVGVLSQLTNPTSNNVIGNTEPSKLPMPVLRNYTAQAMIHDTEVASGELKVYPNPTDGLLTVEFDNLLEGEKILKVFNAQGQLVIAISFEDQPYQKMVGVEHLTAGMYEIVLIDSRGLAATSKFIKK